MYNNGLFIFTRDLRIVDNIGLNEAIKQCKHVYTIFVFTPEQVTHNSFKSNNAVQFMIESLQSLEKEIANKGGKLLVYYGDPSNVVKHVLTSQSINAVFINQEITPYGRKRFETYKKVCDTLNVVLEEFNDYYLTSPGSIRTTSGSNYLKFTPYYNKIMSDIKAQRININRPQVSRSYKFDKNDKAQTNLINLKDAMKRFGGHGSPQRLVHGGREEGLKKLRSINQRVSDYEATRNDLEDETTQLSAYIKFGCISIRETYHTFKDKLDKKASESLIRQLFWRDFYAQVLFNNPEVLFKSMNEKYRRIKWSNSKKLLEAWQTGTTGFPIVDAGMREMLQTGYMHNRARLIVGSFLPKTLLINWQEGEKHFAKTLTDYDPASNNGNWQWVAGTGADSQPYFRILNPFLQSKKYDPDASYIKRWVPELKDVPAQDIHKWNVVYANYKDIKYPKPIVDYTEQKTKVLDAYNKAA